jgi:hypothetical protein
MAERLANNPISKLAAAIDADDTSLTVLSASLFPDSGTFRIRIDSELLLVTAVSGTTFTVTRGAESTTATNHTSQTTVQAVLTAAGLAAYVEENGVDAIDDVPGLTAALAAKQPLNANLTAEAGLTGAADRVSYFNGVGSKLLAVLTALGRSLVGSATQADARTALGLGTAATSNTGDFAAASHAHDAAAITTGVLDPARIPVLFSGVQVVSTGGIANLDAGQQATITAGAIVTTTDGQRWVYSGSGSKTSEASYILSADVTPDWSVIANKPTLGTAADNAETDFAAIAPGSSTRNNIKPSGNFIPVVIELASGQSVDGFVVQSHEGAIKLFRVQADGTVKAANDAFSFGTNGDFNLLSGSLRFYSAGGSITCRQRLQVGTSGETGANDTLLTLQAHASQAVPIANFTNSGGTTLCKVDEVGAVTTRQLYLTQSALTYAATTNIDCAGGQARTLALTGAVTFTTSNKAAGRSVTIKITCDATPRTFTFPAGWKFVGAAAPSGIAASKVGILTLTCFGTNDSDVVAAYAEEP